MQKYATDPRSDNSLSGNGQDTSFPTRSYTAMILSAFLPGLGQIYLHQVVKGCIIFFVFITAIGLFYLNSYPVRGWDDLLRFHPERYNDTTSYDSLNSEDNIDNSFHIWTLENGKTLMFRPSWILKITAFIQALFCWIYAVYGGWRGRPQIHIVP